MLHDRRPAGMPAVRFASRPPRRFRRSWRRRSRRAQVSAVATILGLLLVVVFIANYISTVLPNTMGQNDLEHEVLVQNQVAQFGQLLWAYTSSDAVGAQVSAPVTLGTAGAPPFAGPDPSTLQSLLNQSSLSVSFTITGPSTASRTISFSTLASPCNSNFCAGSGFRVSLQNTYAPSAVVAYEQGAVVYVQPASIPVFVVPPPISLTQNVFSIFVPQFFNSPVYPEQGTGLADLNLRLLSANQLDFPSNGFSLLSGSSVTVTVVSPYVAGWDTYFSSVSSLSSYVSCPSSVCTQLYDPTHGVGTLTLSIPVSQFKAFDLLVGSFSFAVR